MRAALAVGSVASCGASKSQCDADGPSRTLAASVPSPDGAYTALKFRTNGGATTPFGAVVCVEHAGLRRVIASAGRSGGTTLRWASNTELDIADLQEHEPTHRIDVTRDQPPLVLYRNGSVGCRPAQPCPALFHCAIDQTCWRDGQDPDPAVVRSARLRLEGVEISVQFHDAIESIDSFTITDAGIMGFEASRFRYPLDTLRLGGSGAPNPVALSASQRRAVLAAASAMAFSPHDTPRVRDGCARVVRSRGFNTEFATVCLPDSAPLLDVVAGILGRHWR